MSDFDSPTNAARQSSAIVELLVVAAVIIADGRMLAAKRLAGGAASEKWEFPGGKVEIGESPELALAREIHEELGLHIIVDSFIGTFATVVGDRRICLRCYWCHVIDGEAVLQVHSEVRWLALGDLAVLDWAAPDVPVVAHIQACGANVNSA